MKNIICQITKCVAPLNEIDNGLGDLVFKTLKEKQDNHRLAWMFKKFGIKFPSFSNQEYKLSTLVFNGTPMTGKYKVIYNKLIKN
jgi:hypothetical protein